MPCKALWDGDLLRIGDALAERYVGRLGSEGLLDSARESRSRGETGGAGRDESDRHFAGQFSNSAARTIYVCIDPLNVLEDVSYLIHQFFADGRVLLVEVPCGSGAGSLGLLSALYEQRKNSLLPTTDLRVDVLGGDISMRGMEHFQNLAADMAGYLKDQRVDVTFRSQVWDATDIRSSSSFIDTLVNMAAGCDQVFLLVSNFSDALSDCNLSEKFHHFLGQFVGRIAEPYSVCWVEPTSNRAVRTLSVFGEVLSRLASWLKFTGGKSDPGVRYRFFDPVLSCEVHSGVQVLRAEPGSLS